MDSTEKMFMDLSLPLSNKNRFIIYNNKYLGLFTRIPMEDVMILKLTEFQKIV